MPEISDRRFKLLRAVERCMRKGWCFTYSHGAAHPWQVTGDIHQFGAGHGLLEAIKEAEKGIT